MTVPEPSPYHLRETADERDRRYASERESDRRLLDERFAAQNNALDVRLAAKGGVLGLLTLIVAFAALIVAVLALMRA